MFSVGDYVKITRQGESFWVHVTEIKPKICYGLIANHLIMYKKKYGDRVRFARDDICDINKRK